MKIAYRGFQIGAKDIGQNAFWIRQAKARAQKGHSLIFSADADCRAGGHDKKRSQVLDTSEPEFFHLEDKRLLLDSPDS